MKYLIILALLFSANAQANSSMPKANTEAGISTICDDNTPAGGRSPTKPAACKFTNDSHLTLFGNTARQASVSKFKTPGDK